MRIKQICIIVFCWFVGVPALHAQTFDKLWKQVEQAEKKSLPETVIKLTDEIYRKGEKEKSSPEMLKAYMWRMKYREVLTPDSFYVSVNGLEQWTQQADKPMDRAILHSLLAGIYADYAANNSWQLRQRTEVVDETPSADMREWTSNMFVEKVRTHTSEAMADSSLLLKTSSRTYIPFVVLGETSEYYHHDMYHLLASRSIEALNQLQYLDKAKAVNQDIEHIYKNMLSAYQAKGDKEGVVLTSLNYLNWKRDANPNFRPFQAKNGLLGLTQDPYIAGLNKLKAEYKSLDICAEVYLAKAEFAQMQEQPSASLQLCDEAIRLYPGYRRINALKNLREEILSPYLEATAARMAYPGQEVKLQVGHKNLDGFTLQLFLNKKMISTQHFPLKRSTDYLTQRSFLTFKAPGVGKYMMRIVPDTKDKEVDNKEFSVTRFKVLTYRLPQNQCEAITLDAETGHPIANAKLLLYDHSEKKLIDEQITNADGKVVFPWKNEYAALKATLRTDTAMLPQNLYGGRNIYNVGSDKPNEQITLLTDRSLYRPGQTVYVKGIAYQKRTDSSQVLADREYTLILKDANNQEVGQRKVRTNDFGSFTADFALPAACLNGMFSLQAGDGRLEVRVEDYKRPTFDITFDKQQGSYRLGDEIQVKGKVQSYSGVLLQNLPVKYMVKRSTIVFWRFARDVEVIASGKVMLNDNGEFSIPVRLTESDAEKNNENVFYRYAVEAEVTNVAGETQSSTDVIPAGNRSLQLETLLGDKVCKDNFVPITFNVRNLNNQPVETEGTYRLFRAKDSKWEELEKEPASSGTFTSNKEMQLDWKNIPSGAYLLKVSVKDAQGKEVTAEVKTILFSLADKRPPVAGPIWYYGANTEFDAAHPAVFYFGTSEKDAYVLMNAFSGDKLLESKVLNLSDSIVRFEYPYRESYGEGAFVNFCLIRNGEVYQQGVSMKKRLPDDKLTLKWEVFRDKLRPGQKEEWKLTIRTPEDKAANAEMLATMYDASLDKIWANRQGFYIFYNRILPTPDWAGGYTWNNSFNSWWGRKNLKVPEMEYDRFVNPQARIVLKFQPPMVPGVMRQKSTAAGNMMIRGVAQSRAGAMMDNVVAEESVVAYSAEKADSKEMEAEPAEETLSEAPVGLRTNLAETAFFYPQLRTNEQGEISFSFTMPESLTSWNFRGYSHTKEMFTGTLDGKATTSKEFMLTPNLPRFVRVGDKTSIAASIANMTGKLQAGTVTLTLFDPMTEKVVDTQKQKFSVEAGKTIGVNFLFAVGDKYEVLGCRIIADSGTFSDGEQQLLPVLSNKVYLTETLPMPVRGEETRTFSLDNLFNHHSKTATDRSLTVEFTGNPSWYAIQALPSLSLPVNNNALSWATAYYANTLASYIMNSQPRIKAIFDSWKLQGGTKETFLNNLQKNQEVKNILLSESPWVLEAQTEQQQKERIATLFDLNNIRVNNIAALTRLQELQNSDGAWSWYKGMMGSQYVTTYIAELNARLAMLTGEQPTGQALELQNKAFVYLHKSALEEYKNILKLQKDGTKPTSVSGSILQYLYLVAISGEQVPAANKAAYSYFLSKVNEMLSSSPMDTKAIASIILDKAGRKKEAQEFVASLKEHLTKTDEQGMFFAFNENPYVWGGMQLQAQVNVMEALQLIGGNSETVEEMKLWLLKQKQTQQWNSPITTADAVYALLMKGVNLLNNQGDVRITIGGEVLETVTPAKTTVPGLGYVKQTYTQKNVVDARSIKVEKRNPGISWGAVYAQYQSPISDVKQQGGELNVQKQLYVERLVNNVAQLQPITGKTVLQIGDKVVSRLSIRIDRAMDFVQLKDQRGACFEPIGFLSGYRWNNSIGYYVDIKDASTNFFFDRVSKGVYVLEYSYRVSRAGTYETGLATIQCAYSPEYASHSDAIKVEVK